MTTPRARRRLRARTAADAVAVAPFTLVIDTREQLPWDFADIPADAHQGGPAGGCVVVPVVVVPVVVGTLGAGDYSVQGWESRVAVERKSAADLVGTIGQGRDRFERELERLAVMDFATVVVEAELSELKLNPPPHSQLQFKTITRSVQAWQQRYPRVHWMFLPGRRAAMLWGYRVLERWVKERERERGKEGAEVEAGE